jgi:Skp family chaperone for outer membrane proteins
MSRALLAGVLAALSVAPAIAWSATPTPDASALGGPQIPGLCSLSQQAVLANAKVGAAASARLKQLTEQSQAEVNAERTALEAEAKALEAPGLKAGELQQRRQTLNRRVQALQEKAALRSREIEATREKALARIAGEVQPVIAQVYGAHACGLLIDRNGILGGNMAGDLTAEVVQGLDAKISTITFERETLAAAPSAPAGH